MSSEQITHGPGLTWDQPPVDRTLHMVSAPTLGSKEKDDRNGFFEVRLHREGSQYVLAELYHMQRGDGTDWSKEHGPIPLPL